jgi:hypothetical protein
MRPYVLQSQAGGGQKPSGAKAQAWADVKTILGAKYTQGNHGALAKMLGLQYLDYSDVLLTRERDIRAKAHRIKDGGAVYTVERVIPDGRYQQVFLKRAEEGG